MDHVSLPGNGKISFARQLEKELNFGHLSMLGTQTICDLDIKRKIDFTGKDVWDIQVTYTQEFIYAFRAFNEPRVKNSQSKLPSVGASPGHRRT